MAEMSWWCSLQKSNHLFIWFLGEFLSKCIKFTALATASETSIFHQNNCKRKAAETGEPL